PDGHIHRDAEFRMDRPLKSIDFLRHPARLILEQINRMAGVMPQQMIGPAPRFAERIGIGATEKIRLYIELLKCQLPGLDPVVDPLVARVEAADMTGHRNEPGPSLRLHKAF